MNKKAPSLDNDFKSNLKHEIKQIDSKKHRKDKKQVKTAGGVGFAGLVGTMGLEAIDFLGENVAEFIGGGTGIGILIFFVTKFFAIEAETVAESLQESNY